MFEMFIVVGTDKSGYGGAWGAGETLKRATAQFRKAGGRSAKVRDRFSSDLPFAPAGRDALESEADAYVSGDGSTCWIRCERHREFD